MASWTQKKLLVTMGSVALFVCMLAGGGVYYTQGLIDEIEASVQEKAQAVLAADAKIKKIPTIENEVIILRENLGEYVKILPDDKELVEFVRMLQRFERESGIKSTGLVQSRGARRNGKGRFVPISYTYDMTATLWQGLKFMNLIENFERFVNITDFSIKKTKASGGDVETIDGEVVHAIKLTMQTYKYNKAASGKEVAIPNYEDRMAQLREEIWKRMQDIRLAHYEHPGILGRRDIFVDPRESGLDGGTDPSNAEQREVLQHNIDAVAELQKIADKSRASGTTLMEQVSLRKLFKSKLSELLASLEEDSAFIVYRPYRLRWAQEVVAPIEALQQRAIDPTPEPDLDPYLPAEEIQTLLTLMAEDCNNGQLDQARKRYEMVQERLAVPQTDPRYGLVVEAKSWHHKARTALEFKGLDLNIQGVVVNQTGRSGMLLNGEVFEEGDYIAEELLVKQVDEEQVWFVFRGLTLVRTM
jgi:Tfp pilus assembly protein PilO